MYYVVKEYKEERIKMKMKKKQLYARFYNAQDHIKRGDKWLLSKGLKIIQRLSIKIM